LNPQERQNPGVERKKPMDQLIVKAGKELRCGYTTGSCATAAAKACAMMLLNEEIVDMVMIDTPKGVTLQLQVEDILRQKEWVSCSISKDAGDDPDVTNGIKISARVERSKEGIQIHGGKGVGRVTKEGLSCAVGEAAINPIPRQMILEALKQVAKNYKYKGGFSVIISAANGEEIAKKTFNPRLGIVDGISILGTSGIVEPMSEKALIDTIHLEINSKTVRNSEYLLISPGNYGRDFALREFGLDIEIGVKCSNFIGETIDYAVYKKVKNILLIGHAGKLCKIAGGIMNTHSRVADCRCEIFAAHAALAGASQQQIKRIMEVVTTEEISQVLQKFGLASQVFKSILQKIEFHLNQRAAFNCRIEVIMFTNKSWEFYQTEGAKDTIKNLKGCGC
jgi:cobalt-precorrin-5B (C1)-methyltransferase